MRMIFVFCPESAVNRVRGLIDVHEAYGLMHGARPRGAADRPDGDDPGSHAASTVVITAAAETKAQELLEALASYNDAAPPEERVQVYQVPVERIH